MNLLSKMWQDATYWAPGDKDLFGKVSFTTPVQMKCRWENRMESIQSKTGEEYVSKSRVFLAVNVDLDGYLYPGLTSELNPIGLDGAQEIQAVGRVPDLRNTQTLYMAYL